LCCCCVASGLGGSICAFALSALPVMKSSNSILRKKKEVSNKINEFLKGKFKLLTHIFLKSISGEDRKNAILSLRWWIRSDNSPTKFPFVRIENSKISEQTRHVCQLLS